MKIALFRPNIPDENTTPSLGLLYLAGSLAKNGYEVRVFDACVDSNVVEEIIKFCPDILGATAVTPGVIAGLQVVRVLKTVFPKLVTIFGGPHPTVLPEETLKENPIIDYIMVGECENSLVSFVQVMEESNFHPSLEDLKSVPNLFFRSSDGSIIHSIFSGFLSDLDSLPRPAYHLMDVDKYFKGTQTHGLWRRGKRILPIITSRGCPHTCTFCNRILGRKPRFHSVDWVVEEVNRLVNEFGVDEIFFEDDCFFVNRDRALKILDRLSSLSNRPYLKLANGVRADEIDAELLDAFKRAGGYAITFGIESGSPNILRLMKKNLDLELVKSKVALAKEKGFIVGGNFIIGYPGETPADVRESIKFMVNLNLHSMAIVNLVPFPGTEVRKLCEDRGYLTPAANDWSNYYFAINAPIPLISTPELSDKELVRLVRWAYRKAYLRSGVIWNAINNLSLRQLLKASFKLLFPK